MEPKSKVLLKKGQDLTDPLGERQPYRQSPILAYHEFFWLKLKILVSLLTYSKISKIPPCAHGEIRGQKFKK